MSLWTARRFSWILALLPAFGCGTKDLRQVVEDHKANVEPRLTQLAAIRTAAKTAPPVTTDAVTINGPAPKIGTFNVDEHVNVAIEYLEDLEDLASLGNVPFRITGSGSMNRCAAIFATRRRPYDPILGGVPEVVPWYTAEEHLKHCEAVRYVFVIRSLAYSSPSVIRTSAGACPNPPSDSIASAGSRPAKPADAGAADAGASAAKPCEVFDGGYLSADVLVFDIKSGTQLGGFRFIAESSPRVDVNTMPSNHSLALGPDFATRIRTAFTGAAQISVPSFTAGY